MRDSQENLYPEYHLKQCHEDNIFAQLQNYEYEQKGGWTCRLDTILQRM